MAPGERELRMGWARGAAWAAVVGMISWVVGVALIPWDAKLEAGDGPLSATIASISGRLDLAAMLAVLGGVLLVAFFAALTRLVPEGEQGWGLVRVALAGCVMTQTMVAIGACFALAGFHAAAASEAPGIVAFAWRGLWLTFTASAIPTVLFTITAVLGMAAAGLAVRWVGFIGWLSAAVHVVAVFTLAQSGPFAPDGLVGALTPVTTVVWIIAAAVGLRGGVRRQSLARA